MSLCVCVCAEKLFKTLSLLVTCSSLQRFVVYFVELIITFDIRFSSFPLENCCATNVHAVVHLVIRKATTRRLLAISRLLGDCSSHITSFNTCFSKDSRTSKTLRCFLRPRAFERNIVSDKMQLTYCVRALISVHRVAAAMDVVALPILCPHYYWIWMYSSMSWSTLAPPSTMKRRPIRAIISAFRHRIDVTLSLSMALAPVCCMKEKRYYFHFFVCFVSILDIVVNRKITF